MLRNNKAALSTISGLIEGGGSLAAAIVQILVSQIDSRKIFFLFMLLAISAVLSLLKYFIKDVKHIVPKKNKELVDETNEN